MRMSRRVRQWCQTRQDTFKRFYQDRRQRGRAGSCLAELVRRCMAGSGRARVDDMGLPRVRFTTSKQNH